MSGACWKLSSESETIEDIGEAFQERKEDLNRKIVTVAVMKLYPFCDD